MECPYCLGREPEFEWDNGSTDKVTEFMGWHTYIDLKRVRRQKYVHRLIHKQHGFTIEIHDCVDSGDWAFKLIGPWPMTQSAINQLDAFLKYVRRVAETRGRKPEVQLEDVFDALRRLPDSAQWLDVADYLTKTLQPKYGDDFDASVDRLKKILQRKRLTLKTARQKAKEDK